MTIFKEKSARVHSDIRLIAGDAAEKQVAFYLKRGFGESPNVFVFNDLRIVRGEDVAQIDHLVIHRCGAVIIESKSVSTRVKVNAAGEWERYFDGKWKGMPSPVAQARLQADLLLRLLRENKESLLGKVMFLQKGFTNFEIAVLVAVSENGSIDRESPDLVPEATKADFVCDKAKAIIASQQKAAKLSTSIFGEADRACVEISEKELQDVCAFLKGAHVEKSFPAASKPAGEPTSQSMGFGADSRSDQSSSVLKDAKAPIVCVKCRSVNGDIQYGKYGYYWKCKDCDGNSKLVLPGAGRLRKEGRKFFYCPPDGGEEKIFYDP